MSPEPTRWAAGTAGLCFAGFAFAGLPLYFVYPGAPPDWNVLTRVLLGALGLVPLLVFAVLWGQLIKAAAPALEWLAALTVSPLLIQIALTFTHFSLEAGTVLVTPAPIDPTRDGVLAPAQFLLQGSFGRLLSATFLAGSTAAILVTRMLPRWTAMFAVLVGVLQLAFVPTLYFPPDPSQFYGSVGWGATAFAPAFLVAWIGTVSVAMLRSANPPRRAGTAASRATVEQGLAPQHD